jgi:DNA-binding MarR family transcriptional regulator
MLTRPPHTGPGRTSPPGGSALPEAEDIDALTDAVLTASRLLVAVSARSIAAIDESITIPQFRMLVVLDSRGPLKLTRLAEYLAVAPSAVTRMADRLVAAGLINREANPTSRRELVVALTETGSATVREVTHRRRVEISRIVTRMPASSRQGLVRALAAFAEAGGERPVTEHAVPLWL